MSITKKLHPRSTRVVHLKRKNGEIIQDCDVYIGRACQRGGWNLPRSKWANIFFLGTKGMDTPRKVLDAYKSYVKGSPHLMSSLHELCGKRLGCWYGTLFYITTMRCKPKPCHGDVLVELVKATEPPLDALESNDGGQLHHVSDTIDH